MFLDRILPTLFGPSGASKFSSGTALKTIFRVHWRPKKKKKERESSNTTECIIKNNQREFKVKIILLFLGSAVKISFTLYTVRFNFIFRDLSFLRQNFNLYDILCLRKLRSQKIKLNLIRTSFLQLNPLFF